MLRISRIATIALAAFLVVGCKMNIISDVYVTDLRDTIDNPAAGLMTSTTIAIEIPSTDKCDEYTTRIGNVIGDLLAEYEPKGCSKADSSSWLRLAVQVPLSPDHASDALFSITTKRRNGGSLDGKLALFVTLNTTKYQILEERMHDEFFQTIDLASSKIQITLHNDERKPVDYWVAGAFHDGKPVYFQQQFSLERRHSAEIVISNVGAATLATNGFVSPVTLGI